MAFSTFSAPASAGFSFSTLAAKVGKGISGFFESLLRSSVMASTAQARLSQAEALNAKTDAELAELGLKREDIVHHVFRDMFWT
jgi:uncharacterized protein YjiS (DUF1127 family)